ncbi:MAG: fluoride efflux transporter CrcB [Alphaproteobacteria bacterium]|nr:fluoride efflux transporter CrcB [Alphaproteobacteria bacterium]OJV47055.1 MAG: camphor resistance protein CrcB [Alphaproteobacteria bacterium 43-37]
MAYIWVAIGSALGGAARYWCSELFTAAAKKNFPWETILVNIIGSFIIGLFASITEKHSSLVTFSSHAKLFITAGICGGFTTFSAFSLQTLTLLQKGKILEASLNISLSVVLCLIFVWLGYALGALASRL